MPRELLNLDEPYEGRCWRKLHADGYRMATSHTHDELEINLVISGYGAYMIDAVQYNLMPGTLLFLYPDQEHILLAESDDFNMCILVCRQRFLQQSFRTDLYLPLRNTMPAGAFCKQLSPSNTAAAEDVFAELQAAEINADRFNLTLGYALTRIWDHFNAADEGVAARRINKSIAEVVRLISNQHETITVARLADMVDMEPSHLSRLFKKQIGLSITEYRQYICLESFMDICSRRKKINITMAALEAGFGSYPQFYRIFKARFGQAPFKYLSKTYPKLLMLKQI